MKRSAILGVDPGYRTGLAYVSVPDLPTLDIAMTCASADAIGVMDAILTEKHPGSTNLICAVQTPIMAGKTARWNRGDRSGIGLAKNAALAGEIIGWLRGRGYDVLAIPPTRGMGAKSALAFNAAFGNRIPSGRISEHARDAAMLALHAQGRWLVAGGE